MGRDAIAARGALCICFKAPRGKGGQREGSARLTPTAAGGRKAEPLCLLTGGWDERREGLQGGGSGH